MTGMRLDIQCVDPGAAWNNANNLFTTNYLRTDVAYFGKPWKIFRPDGTMQLISYQEDQHLPGGNQWIYENITTRTGTPNSGGTDVNYGTSEEVWNDEFG